MHEKRFNREIERLRDPERIARLEIDRVVDLALEGLNDIQSVLDIGTGSGLFAEKFAEKGFQVTGLDANPEMLPAAQKYVPSATFKEGNAELLPFSDGSFDLIFMGLLLHETDDIESTFREAHRVALKRLAILEWPYEEQLFGPPLEHRVSNEKMTASAKLAGFTKIHNIRLESLILYIFDC
jgi:ubiquinone/menaquinone biosynthesis C-methylase UbiE